MDSGKKVSISTVCVCPLNEHPDLSEYKQSTPGSKIEQLKVELSKTNYELVEKKGQLLEARRQLAALQRILHLELGFEARPHEQLSVDSKWKKRSHEKNYLKSELIHLVDYLREKDPAFRVDAVCHPAKLSASMQHFLGEKQRERLRHLYENRTSFHTGNVKNVGDCLLDYTSLKEDYQNKLFHNRMLVDETERLKQQIKIVQKKDEEYLDLMNWVSSFEFHQKGFKTLVENMQSDSQKVCLDKNLSEPNPELVKYKSLWEENMNKKSEKQEMIKKLEKLMEKADCCLEEACAINVDKAQINQLKEQIKLLKVKSDIAAEGRKFNISDYTIIKNELRKATDENRCLRKFLREAILPELQEFKHMGNSLTSTAQSYNKILFDIRDKILKKNV